MFNGRPRDDRQRGAGRVGAVVLLAACLLLAACSSPGGSGRIKGSGPSASAAPAAPYDPRCPHPPGPLPAAASLSVDGGQLTSAGRPFVVHGVILEGLQDSPATLARGTSTDDGERVSLPQVAAAQAKFGVAELTAIRCFGANTVRVHLGQPVADPRNQLYSPAYLRRFAADVRAIRGQGLAVIVDLQDEPLSGEQHGLGNPTTATLRAWRAVIPLLANVPGVLFEPFNEPILAQHAPGAWHTWLDGGTAATYHHAGVTTIVGVQQLVNTIRGLGARNPVILEGLQRAGGGWTLHGMPAVADPGHQLVYAVHFPPTGQSVTADQPQWDQAFGAGVPGPVIITAFNVSSAKRCTPDAATTATDLITRYLPAHHVGVVGWAFDWPGTIFQASYTGPPTTFPCAAAAGGDGLLLHDAYTSQGSSR